MLFLARTSLFVFLYAETFQHLHCSLNIIKCLVFGYEVFLFYSFLIARFNFISSQLYYRGEYGENVRNLEFRSEIINLHHPQWVHVLVSLVPST
jgi:hypothetical protein